MKRYFTKYLQEWKTKPDRKPLIVRGARQVGKTYIIQEFAMANFERVVSVNFERMPQLIRIFDSELSAAKIIEQLELVLRQQIEDSKTILFFDEVQKCPRAIMALRYFYEERPGLAVIAAGSLIEFALSEISVPVGRVSFATLYPLSFGEFLLALGEDRLVDFLDRELPTTEDAVHQKLLGLLKTYYIVGGMPQAVTAYVRESSILPVQQVHVELIESYKQDFSKYARQSRHVHLLKVIERLPQLVGAQVKFSTIDREVPAAAIREAILLLERAHVLYRVRATAGKGLPLSANASDKYFKLVFVDVGLFQTLAHVDWSQIAMDADLTAVYNGALAENFVGQELLAAAPAWQPRELFYWRNEALNAAAEIDYLIEAKSAVVPIEVKSAKKGRLKSLAVFTEKYSPKQSYVISARPYAVEKDLTWLPLYAARWAGR